jgi:enamine deaminase RidA (YjgF/YER057c/UK114 family)
VTSLLIGVLALSVGSFFSGDRRQNMSIVTNARTVQSESSEGVGCSVVDLNDVRHIFCAAAPGRGDTIQQQAMGALETISEVIGDHGPWGTIVNQTVFYSEERQLNELRTLMRDFYGPDLPVITFVPQHPCDGKLVAIEALGIAGDDEEVEIERWSEHVVIARHNGSRWVHFGQIVPQTSATSVYARAFNCFGQIRSLLANAGVHFDETIRTWIYQGNITGSEGRYERYQELNRARTDFFRHRKFCPGLLPPSHEAAVYPASTGIGTDNHDLVMSGIAFATEHEEIVAVPLENPRQTAAFDYASRYSPTSPKFSRAMALSCGQFAMIFISGTASITNSETRHVGDVEAQTHETINNIEALISEQNLTRHGLPSHGTTLDGLSHIRVYIKNARDYARVRAVCDMRLGGLPAIYAVADVCRSDLLVEIEGVACTANALIRARTPK